MATIKNSDIKDLDWEGLINFQWDLMENTIKENPLFIKPGDTVYILCRGDKSPKMERKIYKRVVTEVVCQYFKSGLGHVKYKFNTPLNYYYEDYYWFTENNVMTKSKEEALLLLEAERKLIVKRVKENLRINNNND